MVKRKKLGFKERTKILEESYKAGCNITELAKKHKISSELLYAWRTRYKKSNNGILEVPNAGSISSNSNKFVEVMVSEAAIEQENERKGTLLQKALLEYENLIITVEGSQSKKMLPEIMKIMETVTC